MLEWEKKPSVTKTDYIAAKNYFEELVKAADTYAQNAGAGTTGRNKYEPANHMADIFMRSVNTLRTWPMHQQAPHRSRPPIPWAKRTNSMPWLRRSKPSLMPLPNSRTQRRTRTQTPAEAGERTEIARADAHK